MVDIIVEVVIAVNYLLRTYTHVNNLQMQSNQEL